MISISVCMIVKNEAAILPRCLDSLQGIWDELIIVDTGSTDETIETARKYTNQVYSFEWTGDFSEARNYCLGYASCDYIYTADADEILEGENRIQFQRLKECLDTRIDVVQMYYGNQLDRGTVYNYDKELRPKLFKRVRPIRFMDPIHETLDLNPVIYDSDIVITHKPTSMHAGRDLSSFARIINSEGRLSPRLQKFYDRELFLKGTEKDWQQADKYLQAIADGEELGMEAPEGVSDDEILEVCTLLAHLRHMQGDIPGMFDNVVKVVAMESNSEICNELASYYLENNRLNDAALWYYNAWHECSPILSIREGKEIPLNGLIKIYDCLGDAESVSFYREQLQNES